MERPGAEGSLLKEDETELQSDVKNEGLASQTNNAKENPLSIPVTNANVELLTSIPLIMPQ